ncbi:endonuclease/exonuclease/phosphatase family protein [Tranquillimonas alkanivorans]|uniref:Metal-dependent hydrolase, endonuclease/exonuclease/phosphatase family n=1 Tax=Tranquillimonas alkanivorans TaxID=441119 RepID=A0A1I5LD61_9RHOB|nr:endonuclease/exonuclease/phosphatase family protein [Tranquillimonas alkanivorans]SFO95240.1 Metal-dependent hydrolase, endonuclease/exonuclease/phosphatase family [Tranquillimonas alkanivorans]
MRPPPKPEGHLRLASYNIRKAVGLDWRRDPGRILRVISDLDADIVVLQEVDKRLGDRPTVLSPAHVEHETGFCAAPVSINDVSLGWHGNAILVRKGIDILDTERIFLTGIEPRGAVTATVAAALGEITVVGVHLGLRRRCRLGQLRAIRAHLGDDRHTGTVIAGDFNEWSAAGMGLRPLEGRFEIMRPGRSFHAAAPVAALDCIALGGELTATDSGVVQTPLTRKASDHLPIWVDIRRAA